MSLWAIKVEQYQIVYKLCFTKIKWTFSRFRRKSQSLTRFFNFICHCFQFTPWIFTGTYLGTGCPSYMASCSKVSITYRNLNYRKMRWKLWKMVSSLASLIWKTCKYFTDYFHQHTVINYGYVEVIVIVVSCRILVLLVLLFVIYLAQDLKYMEDYWLQLSHCCFSLMLWCDSVFGP